MPNKLKDLSGTRIGSWTVLHRDGKISPTRWICKCDCGTVRSVSAASLRNNSLSCGRCKQNVSPLFLRKHSNTLYHTWSAMRQRCNGVCTNSQYYSGKGIFYSSEWNDFDVFAKWAISNGYKPGLEIDRIDSDKDYCPDNCRWVSHRKNSRNRKARSNNSTGTPGVQVRQYENGRIVYRVTITSDVGRVNVGTFNDIEAAIAARKKAEIKYWGFNIGE